MRAMAIGVVAALCIACGGSGNDAVPYSNDKSLACTAPVGKWVLKFPNEAHESCSALVSIWTFDEKSSHTDTYDQSCMLKSTLIGNPNFVLTVTWVSDTEYDGTLMAPGLDRAAEDCTFSGPVKLTPVQ